MSNLRDMAVLSALGLFSGADYGPVARDWRPGVKVGRPWTKAKARNRRRNRIARASRKANR